MPSITVIRTIAAIAFLAAVSSERVRAADDIDALFLGGYWCRTEETEKSEDIPRNRSFLLSRRIEGPKTDDAFTERLIDVVGDVRGQRIILAQKLKLPDGKECKTDCLTAQRIVNKDLLEFGEWNSNTGVFKSFSPRDYLYRCEK